MRLMLRCPGILLRGRVAINAVANRDEEFDEPVVRPWTAALLSRPLISKQRRLLEHGLSRLLLRIRRVLVLAQQPFDE